MNSSTHDITLNIHGHGSNVSVRAKRGDTGRVLRITLMDGRKPYAITEECRAVLTAKKEDGNILYNGCEIVGNTICYEFTPQTTSCAGRAKCEIKLYGADDKLLTSARFALLVEDTVYNEGDEVESEKEVSELTQLISRAAELIADIEKKLAENAYADAHSAVCFTPQDLMDSQKDQARRNIGAAPAGYGLGTIPADLTDVRTLDDTVLPGWYRWMGGDENKLGDSFSYCAIRVDSLDSTAVCQTAIETSTRASMVRWKGYGSGSLGWSAWEWVNPPMALGVEYRTTERWQGKPAYTKLVDCGAIANDKIVDIMSEQVTVHRYSGLFNDNTPTPALSAYLAPTVYYELAIYKIHNGVQVRIFCGQESVGQNLKLQLWYTKPIDIDSQPKNVTAPLGETVTFHVVAAGEGLSYQWQWRAKPTYDWSATTITGNKTDTIHVPATSDRNGYQYRCVITDASGNSVASNMATLTVVQPVLAITKQPVDFEANIGDTILFTVEVNRTDVTYQWEYSSNDGATWGASTASGNKTNTLSGTSVTAGRIGWQYRCVITDSEGNTVVSDVATLTLKGD